MHIALLCVVIASLLACASDEDILLRPSLGLDADVGNLTLFDASTSLLPDVASASDATPDTLSDAAVSPSCIRMMTLPGIAEGGLGQTMTALTISEDGLAAAYATTGGVWTAERASRNLVFSAGKPLMMPMGRRCDAARGLSMSPNGRALQCITESGTSIQPYYRADISETWSTQPLVSPEPARSMRGLATVADALTIFAVYGVQMPGGIKRYESVQLVAPSPTAPPPRVVDFADSLVTIYPNGLPSWVSNNGLTLSTYDAVAAVSWVHTREGDGQAFTQAHASLPEVSFLQGVNNCEIGYGLKAGALWRLGAP